MPTTRLDFIFPDPVVGIYFKPEAVQGRVIIFISEVRYGDGNPDQKHNIGTVTYGVINHVSIIAMAYVLIG